MPAHHQLPTSSDKDPTIPAGSPVLFDEILANEGDGYVLLQKCLFILSHEVNGSFLA